MQILGELDAERVGFARHRCLRCVDGGLHLGPADQGAARTGFGGVACERRHRPRIQLEVVLITVVVEEGLPEHVGVVNSFWKRDVEGLFVAGDKMLAAAKRTMHHVVEDGHRDRGAALGAAHLDAIVVFDDGLRLLDPAGPACLRFGCVVTGCVFEFLELPEPIGARRFGPRQRAQRRHEEAPYAADDHARQVHPDVPRVGGEDQAGLREQHSERDLRGCPAGCGEAGARTEGVEDDYGPRRGVARADQGRGGDGCGRGQGEGCQGQPRRHSRSPAVNSPRASALTRGTTSWVSSILKRGSANAPRRRVKRA